MKFIDEIKYRWKYERGSLPGELWPTDGEYGEVRMVYASDCEDEEPIKIFRKIRGLLGYGEGWTLRQVLRSFVLLD